jgi:hypothetical protein
MSQEQLPRRKSIWPPRFWWRRARGIDRLFAVLVSDSLVDIHNDGLQTFAAPVARLMVWRRTDKAMDYEKSCAASWVVCRNQKQYAKEWPLFVCQTVGTANTRRTEAGSNRADPETNKQTDRAARNRGTDTPDPCASGYAVLMKRGARRVRGTPASKTGRRTALGRTVSMRQRQRKEKAKPSFYPCWFACDGATPRRLTVVTDTSRAFGLVASRPEAMGMRAKLSSEAFSAKTDARPFSRSSLFSICFWRTRRGGEHAAGLSARLEEASAFWQKGKSRLKKH